MPSRKKPAKKSHKLNPIFAMSIVVIGLLFIVTALTLIGFNNPRLLKTATDTTSCSRKSKTYNSPPITGITKSNRATAFDYTYRKIAYTWNAEGSLFLDIYNQAYHELDCSDGQPHCTAKEGISSMVCTPYPIHSNHCTYTTNAQGVTATCPGKVNCVKQCRQQGSESPEPNISACSGNNCGNPATMVTETMEVQANGAERSNAIAARISAEEAAKSRIDCSRESGTMNENACKTEACDINGYPSCAEDSATTRCSTVTIKGPPVNTKWQGKATCTYKCACSWPCKSHNETESPEPEPDTPPNSDETESPEPGPDNTDEPYDTPVGPPGATQSNWNPQEHRWEFLLNGIWVYKSGEYNGSPTYKAVPKGPSDEPIYQEPMYTETPSSTP